MSFTSILRSLIVHKSQQYFNCDIKSVWLEKDELTNKFDSSVTFHNQSMTYVTMTLALRLLPSPYPRPGSPSSGKITENRPGHPSTG